MIIWSPGMTLADIEKLVINECMRVNYGNKTQTANALGISVRTIDNKLKEYADAAITLEKNQQKAREEERRQTERARGVGGIDISTPSLKGDACQSIPVPQNPAPSKQGSLP